MEYLLMEPVLEKFIEKLKPEVITKTKHTYLSYKGIAVTHIHVLKEGVVKTSTILNDGREFNIDYINKQDIIAILRSEDETYAAAPWNIRIESDSASFYQIDRIEFWKAVNSDPEMLNYVKNYYRHQLNKHIQNMQQMLMNGKVGALYSLLYRLSEIFGVEKDGGILIDFFVTNEEIANFCGISSHTSVNRMLKDLRENDIIDIQQRKIFIKNLQYIQDQIAN